MNATAVEFGLKTLLIERDGDTVIVTPTRDLNEYRYLSASADAKSVLDLLDRALAKNVVVDLGRTDYYGSSALGFFVQLWNRVRRRHGRMAFCNVSDHEKEILLITHLDHLWLVCPSKWAALDAVRG